MELRQTLQRRHMVRSFAPTPIEPAVIQELVTDALGSPTAGNTAGTAWLTLEGPEETARYWEQTTTASWRASSKRWAGLSRAPVVALSLTSPPAYVARYGEGDKASDGLGPAGSEGGGEGAWPVPYWFGDAAFSTMVLLLGAVDRGLGACFLGSFRDPGALLEMLGVPDSWRLFGTVALGHPDGADHRSPSLDRRNPSLESRLHRGCWQQPAR